MARRPDSAHASTLPASDRSLASQAASDRRALPWWRLRTWRKDLDALTRLRDGLQDMAFDDPAEPAGAVDADTQPAPVAVGGTRPGDLPAAPSPTGADPAIAAIKDTFRSRRRGRRQSGRLLLRPGSSSGDPQLRQLFPPAMDEQRDRLFQGAGRHRGEPGHAGGDGAATCCQLGRDHRKYGVEPEMYEAVGEALIATLRAFARDGLHPRGGGSLDPDVYAAAVVADDQGGGGRRRLSRPAAWTAEVVQVDQLGGQHRRADHRAGSAAAVTARPAPHASRRRAGRRSGGRTRSPACRARTACWRCTSRRFLAAG